MLWELATGGRAFVGMPRALIGHQVFFFAAVYATLCELLIRWSLAVRWKPSGESTSPDNTIYRSDLKALWSAAWYACCAS